MERFLDEGRFCSDAITLLLPLTEWKLTPGQWVTERSPRDALKAP